MKKLARICAVLLVVALLGGQIDMAFANETEKKWSVGFGMAEFIPEDYDPETDSFEKTYYIAGYNNGYAVTGLLDPQCVRAAYISDGETNIVVAAVDCVGLSAGSIENIRSRIAPLVQQYGLKDVHIASTHTHAGIDTLGLWGPVAVDGKDDAFMEVLYDAAAEAIRKACEDAKSGRLYYGSAFTGDLQYDSRLPHVYDKNIHRLRFSPDDGSRGLQIVSYDAHAESLRSENSLVSADYPCYLGRYIKEQTGDEFVFFAGAVGGLIMTKILVDDSDSDRPLTKNVVATGEYLGSWMLSRVGDTERELTPSIEHATKTITPAIDNSALVAMAFAGVLDTTPVPGGGQHSLALVTRVSMLRLGGAEGLSVVMVPGELFPELAHGGEYSWPMNKDVENPTPMKDFIDGDFIIWGLCDDEIGYIVPPRDFLLNEKAPYFDRAYDQYDRRHYEETNCLGPDTAALINAAAEELAGEIQN